MLDGLHAINWGVLRHAYGDASDVPELLQALLSADPVVRGEAIHELFGNIWHQGTVYSASAAAVPFLYELLAAPEARDKPMIACLLASIAGGGGYLEVHAVGDFGERSWRKILEEQGKSLEGELALEAAEIDAVRRAASAGLPHLLPYLRDDEAEVRRSVADALGNHPEHAAVSLPALELAAASEMDEEVREAVQESLARLASRSRGPDPER